MKQKMMLFGLIIWLTACVTINIYFPAAEAQKAADKIIDEVWQLKDGQKPEPGKAPTTQPDAGTEPKKVE